MQELLETLTNNPYSTYFLILILFAIFGIILCALSLLFERPNAYMFSAGSVLTVSTLLVAFIAATIVTSKQQDAIHDSKAHATKEGNVLLIHSESRWLKDGKFEIIDENDDYYFVKDDHIIEVKKLEVGK